jgi:hypothetical protein
MSTAAAVSQRAVIIDNRKGDLLMAAGSWYGHTNYVPKASQIVLRTKNLQKKTRRNSIIQNKLHPLLYDFQ